MDGISSEGAAMSDKNGHVIIAGFGCGGRFIAEYLRKQRTLFVLVELNRETVSTQRELGVEAIYGNIADADVLRQAGIEKAAVLALTVPDEAAALEATEAARRINPDIHIMTATRHTSAGMKARQCGADDVIVAEQVVGNEFHRRISEFISRGSAASPDRSDVDTPIESQSDTASTAP